MQRLERLEGYGWSSYGGYAALAKAQEFVSYDVLREYGRDPAEARRQYLVYVKACLLEDDGPMREAMAACRYAIGGAPFIEKTEARIEERRGGHAQDRDLDLPRRPVPLPEIDAAVSRPYRIEPSVLQADAYRADPAKAVAVALASRLAGTSEQAIGLHYGIGSSAVRAIRRRLAERRDALEVVASLVRELRSRKAKCKV